MSRQRHTIAETICVYGNNKEILRHEIVQVLLVIEKRIPAGATMLPLPADLRSEYKREIHIHYDNGAIMAMEIAINERKEGNSTIYEYSTDYEL